MELDDFKNIFLKIFLIIQSSGHNGLSQTCHVERVFDPKEVYWK